jgi:hypothetical protein
MRKYILAALMLATVHTLFAQSDSTKKEKSYGKFTLEYLNNSVYFGRADSISTPYVVPSIGYYSASGFYVEGSLSYLTRSNENRVDVGNIGAGYEFTKGNFYGEFGAQTNFYNSSSTNVKSEVKGSASFFAQYDLHFIEPYVTTGINFANKSDYFISIGLQHAFEPDSGKFEITPSVVVDGSTRNFYGSYYRNRRFKKKAASVSATVPDASSFKFMDVEFSLPIKYNWKKFSLGFTANYAIPMNPATVVILVKPATGPPVSRTITEKTKDQFYFNLNASVKF